MENTVCELSHVEHWIRRVGQGDEMAREELLHCASDRLMRLTRKMLGEFPEVHRWEQTDDVYQNASLRLWRSLGESQLVDARHFFRLAALQIRRELIDLARHYRGPQAMAAMHASQGQWGAAESYGMPPYDQAEISHNPEELAEWAEFHRQVEALPPEERDVFDLLWYHGLSQEEAAEVLGVSVRTVKRRWREARLHLHAALGAEAFAE